METKLIETEYGVVEAVDPETARRHGLNVHDAHGDFSTDQPEFVLDNEGDEDGIE